MDTDDGGHCMTNVASAADMRRVFDAVSNWGRWGKEDERGTLNLLTPQRVVSGLKHVITGQQVSCSRNFPVHPGPENPYPALHHMINGGDDPCAHSPSGLESARDFIGIAFHGVASTHIDALSHVFVDGRMFNGFAATEVRST